MNCYFKRAAPFPYNALQDGDYRVRVENLQIINGGQTCMTIFKTLRKPDLLHQNSQAYVLLHLYQLLSKDEGLVQRITYATINLAIKDIAVR